MIMRNWHLLAGLLVAAVPGSVLAQYPGFNPPGINPAARPAYSPWLNLNRSGGSLTQNYYGLIRPQVNASNMIQQLQQQTTALQQQEAKASNELPATGHVTGFLNHTKYFLNRGGATPLANRVAAAPPAAIQAAQPKRTR